MSRAKKEAPKRIDLTSEKIKEFLKRVDEQRLDEGDWEIIKGMAHTIELLSQALQEKNISIKRLEKIIFGASTESKKNVLDTSEKQEHKGSSSEDALDKDSQNSNQDPGSTDVTDPHDPEHKGSQPDKEKKPKGHGRNGADSYHGAKRVFVSHATLKSGDLCPGCEMGKVYCMKEPGVVVRVVGRAPIQATVYELEKLRCNLCGEVFTAQAPQEVGDKKYDATAGAMISLLKYGSGFPFYRLEGLQESLGMPLASSTQWGIVEAVGNLISPAYGELFYQAAQGTVIHNDDTMMRILALMNNPAARKTDAEDNSSRTGVFTTGILSIKDGHKIALFLTGTKHAGENMAKLLKERQMGLPPPIQMCDALSRNIPENFITLLANCLSHGRRKFVELISFFPEECRHVIEIIAKVYHHDSITKEKKMSDEGRLKFHQKHSAPLMEELKVWLERQIEQKNVEPNSSLGKAFQYMLNHWEPLTLFLRVPGAPIDNNILERALKWVILHRKNALFYKTIHGAQVGDLFMSLIHTCRLAKANPFDYLTALQQYSSYLSQNPQGWMPWNYQDTIASLNQSKAEEEQVLPFAAP